MRTIQSPNKVWIYVTNACPLNCPHCLPNSGKRHMGELSKDDIFNILKQLSDLGTRRVALTGGEPTLRTDLYDIIARGSELGMRVYLETCGIGLNEKTLKEMKKVGLGVLNLSLDGPSAEYHDSFRGSPGLFNNVIRAIQDASEISLDVRIYCSVTRDNIDVAANIPELFVDYPSKARTFTFAYTVPFGRALANLRTCIPEVRWTKFCEQLEQKRREVNCSVGMIRYEPTFLEIDQVRRVQEELAYDIFCIARGRDWLYISPIGAVYGCVLLMNTPFTLGSLRKQKLTDIWHYSKGWDFFEIPENLEKCLHGDYCQGGCRALAYRLKGSRFSRDPRCQQTGNNIIPICPLTLYPKIEPWAYERKRS